ncbi:MAG TPA: hypothetical protein VLT33_21285 [Labilithrix sp.]|nr:hypothetical protein [Labilithrix sp.]
MLDVRKNDATALGEDLGVQAMPALLSAGTALPGDLGQALEKVAKEALVDGALLEDYNAELAATALPDAAAREALVRVAEDEREHARSHDRQPGDPRGVTAPRPRARNRRARAHSPRRPGSLGKSRRDLPRTTCAGWRGTC